MSVVLSVLTSGSVLAEDMLTVATGEYPPYTDSTVPDGGIVNRIVTRVAEASGYAAQFEYLPWKRSLELTRNGRYMATSYWFYQEDRETDFIHVGPIVNERLVLYHRVDTQLPDWTGIEDLGEFLIGAVGGYTYTDDFWSQAEAGIITVDVAQSDEANMRKLLAGRIDVYPMSEIGGRALLAERFTEAERAQITVDPQPFVVTEGYLLVSRAIVDAEAIAARLRLALERLAQADR